MKPQISIIIPAYNEEKLIGKCIEALQIQTVPRNHYEIIVIDNNSKDNTVKIAKKYGVSVYVYSKMQRVSAVRQYGASLAKAPLLGFVDADSFVDKNWISSVLSHFSEKESLLVVCGVVFAESTRWYIKSAFSLFNVLSQFNQLFGMVLPWGSNFAIRKSTFDSIGGFNLALKTYDDAEIGIRLKKIFGKKSIYYSQKLIVYTSARKHEDFKIFLTYCKDTIINYTNVVILKKANTAEIRNIR